MGTRQSRGLLGAKDSHDGRAPTLQGSFRLAKALLAVPNLKVQSLAQISGCCNCFFPNCEKKKKKKISG